MKEAKGRGGGGISINLIFTNVDILHMQVNDVIISKSKERWEKIERTDQYDTKNLTSSVSSDILAWIFLNFMGKTIQHVHLFSERLLNEILTNHIKERSRAGSVIL